MKISWLIFYVYKLEYIFRIFKHIILFFLIMSTQLIMSIYPVLWPPHMKSWLIGKHSDAGRDWGQEEKGTAEDEMAGWHHWLDGCESEWTPGVGDGQGGLACCDSWGRRVRHDWATELNWTELTTPYIYEIKSKKSNAENIWLGGGILWEIGIDTHTYYYTQTR